MIPLIAVGEGQTEETFIRDVLAPPLANLDISLESRLIRTSASGAGGALSRDRVLRFLRNTLRDRDDTYVTTMFDLYGLRPDFPGFAEGQLQKDPIQRCQTIERVFADAVAEIIDRRKDRFIAHIQPYEFEALLFSDVGSLAVVDPRWRSQIADLHRACDDAESPEHINDGAQTHPSARLKNLRPRYEKVLHGVAITKSIGIETIRNKCSHFRSWLDTLAVLKPLH